jgi:hypothetical protein
MRLYAEIGAVIALRPALVDCWIVARSVWPAMAERFDFPAPIHVILAIQVIETK